MDAFKHIGVTCAVEVGTGRSFFRVRERSLQDSLLNRLMHLSIDQGVPRESRENRPGKEVSMVEIPARVKVDPAGPPQVMIAEAKGIRIWCSVSTDEEFRKSPRAGGRD